MNIFLLSFLVVACRGYEGFGYTLTRTFFVWKEMPLNASSAEQQGYAMISTTSTCDPVYAISYAYGGSPSSSNPQVLHFTPAGQIAGVSLRLYDQPPAYLAQNGWWIPTDDNGWQISVMFRSSDELCSSNLSPAILGYQPHIPNAEASAMQIALNATAAESEGWVRGNCITKMGIHHAFDLASPGQLTWNASTLLPVLPMYDNTAGTLTAVLFAFPKVEKVEPIGDWEGPFPNFLFCKNFCSSECTFAGASFWSTMHWWFTDYSLATCSGFQCS
jgi:hypothetical protein